MENPINLLSCLVWLNFAGMLICTVLTVRTYLVAKAHAKATGLALASQSELLLIMQKSMVTSHEYVNKVVELQSHSLQKTVSLIQKINKTKQGK